MPELEFVNVRKSYRSPAGEDLLALDDFSLKIDGGRFVTVVGPERLRQDHAAADGGWLDPAGIAARSGSMAVVLDGPSPKMSMVFQGIGLMPWKTIQSNVALGIQLQAHRRKLTTEEMRARRSDARAWSA